MTVALIVVAAGLALLALYVVVTFNRLVALRLACESSWAQIDVALKLRHDLVPNLAETVAGYAGHERRTFEEVARARAQAIARDSSNPKARGAAEAALAGSLGSVVLLAEDYPALLASDNFSRLQSDLAEVEEKISITRRVYNDTVETYNTKTQVFPPVIVARAFGFSAKEFFDAPVESEAVPQVSIPSEVAPDPATGAPGESEGRR